MIIIIFKLSILKIFTGKAIYIEMKVLFIYVHKNV